MLPTSCLVVINLKLSLTSTHCLEHFVQLDLAQPPSLMLEEAKASKIKTKKLKKAEAPPETEAVSPAMNIEGKATCRHHEGHFVTL